MSAGIPLTLRWLTTLGVLPKAAVTQFEARRAPVAQSVLDAGRLAENTYALLDALDHEIVLIARAGQNLEQFGLSYSHLGFAVRSLRRQEWGVVHLLNAEDAANSGLYQEGMVNFYSDNPYRMQAAVLTLPPAVQARLLNTLTQHGRKLHCPSYSLTSHPRSLATQNSNQWILEVLGAALADLKNPTRVEVQEWIFAQGYQPTSLPIGLPTQWAAPLLRDCIRFEDQPTEQRLQGIVQTITVESVFDWLQKQASTLAPACGVEESLWKHAVRVYPLSL